MKKPNSKISSLILVCAWMLASGCEPEAVGGAGQEYSPGSVHTPGSDDPRLDRDAAPPRIRPAKFRKARSSVMGRDSLEMVIPVAEVSPPSSAQLRNAQLPLPQIEGVETYPPDAADDDQFGDSLDVFGDLAVVGAWAKGPRNQGAAYLYDWNRGEQRWNLIDALAPASLARDDFFGFQVALNAQTVAVSALRDKRLGEPSGAVYVFEKTGESWSSEVKLRPQDSRKLQEFGFSLCFAGPRLVVGAPGDGGDGTGAVYVFSKNGAGQWQQEQKLVPEDGSGGDLFGSAISATADRILVGARGKSRGEASLAGVAYVFVREDGRWRQEARIQPSIETPNGRFGTSVAIDERSLLVSAATFQDQGRAAGRVFAFERDAVQGWQQSSVLAPLEDATPPGFGYSLDLENNTAVIGAYDTNDRTDAAGRVLVFTRELGSDWTRTQELVPGQTALADGFGRNLALSGKRVIVGAHYQARDLRAPEAGAVHTFSMASVPTPVLPWWALFGLGPSLVWVRRKV